MPKKFAGENSKAVAARNRKAAAKDADTAKKQRAVEDAYWQDTDKLLTKKNQKKEEEMKKKQQALEKKAEVKALLEREMQSITKTVKQPPMKITRNQIQNLAEKKNSDQVTKTEDEKTHIEKPLEENLNRVQTVEVARSVDEAIAILSTTDLATEKHPEKRMKAAYNAFEAKHMTKLKEENPTLRLSQLKQLLYKEWAKSPENPMNAPS